MKKFITILIAGMLCVFAFCGCSGSAADKEKLSETILLEQGESVRLDEICSDFRVTDRNGAEVAVSDGVFTASAAGDYLVEYDYSGETVSAAIKVYPQEAPVITLTEEDDNVLWRTGYTYYVPDARVQDNVDEAPSLTVKVLDGENRELNISSRQITVNTMHSAYYSVVYTAKDRAGNESVKTMKIYTTGETEISSFETLSLMSGWYASDNNRNDTSKYALSYNTDAATNQDGSKGNLRLDLTLREAENVEEGSTAWPGFFIEGSDLPASDISDAKYKGISFDVMYQSDRPYQLNASVISSDESMPDNIYANNSRVIIDPAHGIDIRPGEWVTVELTKEMITANASLSDGTTGEKYFNFADITRFSIWGCDIIEGNTGATDVKVSVFIDNIQYMM